MIRVFTSLVYIVKQNADISQDSPPPSLHTHTRTPTERERDRERERERERENTQKQTITQKNGISKHDTMRAYRTYISTHRKMRRLVRTSTATVMLHRINNTKHPQDFKFPCFFFFFFFFFFLRKIHHSSE